MFNTHTHTHTHSTFSPQLDGERMSGWERWAQAAGAMVAADDMNWTFNLSAQWLCSLIELPIVSYSSKHTHIYIGEHSV